MIRILILLALLGGAFGFGLYTGANKTWPFHEIDAVRVAVLGRVAPQLLERPENPRAELFRALETRGVDVVMIGDSHTALGVWRELLPGVDVVNRGIGGDTSEDILARLDAIVAIEPRRAYLQMGTNDFSRGRGFADVLTTYEIVLARLRAADIDVVVQSTPECVRAACGEAVDVIRALNARLPALAAAHGAAFIDVAAALSDGDGLRADFSSDNVHLNGAGYNVWSRLVAQFERAAPRDGG